MSNVTLKVTLSEEELEVLKKVSKEQNADINELIKVAVNKVFRKKTSKISALDSFGMWRNSKTDPDEFLESLGGNWDNVPLEE